MRIDQLGLLLWKNYVVRKRQPGILALIFFWPVVVFLILYTVQDNVDPEYHPTCQFPARSMPQDGLLPFVQSYICSVPNPCDPLAGYEDVPSYKNATLGPLIVELQPILYNKTIISAVETLPQSIQLLKSMAQILTKPEIKALFDRGIRLGDLFNNHEQIKTLLRSHMPGAREGLIDGLFESSVKLIYLIQTFGSSNIDGVVCSAESLKNYLILPKEEDFAEISNVLCNINPVAIPDILENLSKHLDFNGLLEMVDRAMAKFRDYNFFQDLKRAAETIIDLKTSKKYIPEYLKIREWLPKIILAFQNVTFKEIDLDFINKAIAILDPIFAYERDWPVARSGFLKINRLLGMVKEIVKDHNVNSTEDFFSVMDRLRGAIFTFSSNSDNYENITQILDLSFLILQDGIKLTNKLLDRHADDFELAAEVFDGLRDFFSDNIVNSITYIASLMDNIVQMTHHVAILHDDTLIRIYDISKKHQNLVQKILTNLQPTVYRTIIQSFSRLDLVERLVDNLRKGEPEEVLCREDTMKEIFENYVEFQDKSHEINELFCGDDGKKFITDVYDSFEFDKFGKIVSKTLATMVNVAFKQVVRIESSNLTSVVKDIKAFVTYLDTRKVKYLNWSIFQISDEWKKIFDETQPQGRLDILGIHLSIAKMLGVRSLSYMSIKPDLENMDMIAETILQDLRTNPTSWIGEVRRREAELIESFYLTVSDKEKTLRILEYSNFTRTYCTESNPPDLLNFPKESNSTILKELVCYLSKSVQRNLELNVTNIEIEEATYRQREFNWTAFNEKTIEIYQYIDTLVRQEDQHYDLKKLEELKQDFKTSWTTDVTTKDAWEISVGLICKLFDVMESPLFGIQVKKNWKSIYGLAWATSVIFDNLEKTIDQIEKNYRVVKLSEVLQEMPQTEILVGTFLRNLAEVILDTVDIITLKPVPLISALDDYKERELMWPCIMNESVGSALELRNGSREVVREIERIACNPSLFIKEWKEQPMLMRVRKIFEHDKNVDLPPFNWTLGYTKFRRLVTKFDSLIDNAKHVILMEDRRLAKYIPTLAADSYNIIKDRLPSMKNDWRNTLDHIDLELDKAIDSFSSERSASGIWKQSVSVTDRVLIFVKYFSNVVHKSARIVTNILKNGTGKVSLLSLIGFDNISPIAIFYNQLPYILSTLVNGISDPVVDDHIVAALENKTTITCSMIFDWLSDFKVGLNAEEYRTLKNFTCDLDPENFNVYMDLYIAEITIWKKPTSTYRSYVASIIGDLYELAKTISLTVQHNVIIEPPFSKRYLDHVLQMLKESLEIGSGEGTFHKELKLDQGWSNYRLVVEGVSEVLMHIGNALKNVAIHDYKLETWQLAGNDDTRQMLKILEARPEETVALIATLSTLNETTGGFMPFKDIRKDMCTHHFNSDYWSTTNRTHFLQEVCSFDPYQLLKTATSDEYYNVVTGQTTTLTRSTPLTMSLTKLLDIVSNFTTTSPGVNLRSNIFNITTWENLSNETWDLILRSERSWIHNRNSAWYRFDVTSYDYLVGSRRLLQLLESVIEVASGGDIWQKLRIMHETSKLKPLLTLAEDMPNLLITAVDTFVSSERLDDFIQKLLLGQVHLCDIDRYLIPPSYMRKRGLLASITNFCQKIIMSDKPLTWTDLLPFEGKYNDSYFTPNMPETPESVYETQLMQRVQRFQNILIRVLSDGFKQPKIPAWWTSFEEGTLKDFVAQYKKKDTRTLAYSMVKKPISLLRNFLESQPSAVNCTWCFTLPLEILNSQLMHHNLYSKLLCQMNQLNISEVHNIMINDFNWNKTGSMVKNYKYLNKKKTLNEFLSTFETTLHYIADIIIDFQNETYSDKVNSCFYKFVGGPTYSRPGLYITFLLSVLDMLEKNVYILDSASIHESINNLTRLSEKHVPIWKPLREVVKKSDLADIDAALPNATINVNAILSDLNTTLCRTKIDCQNATVLYNFLSSKRAGKVFRYDTKASKYPSVSDISSRLARSLDMDLISRQLSFWRSEASWNLFWLKEILAHLSSILGEGGNLLDVASKIDLEDVTNILGVPDLADGIVHLLKDKTVDKLFDGMKELLEDVEPFISDQEIIDDLHNIIVTLESMEIFKNLGLLDMKYVVKDMFDNWDVVRMFLIDKIGITNEIALTLGQAKIDMISVFMQERGIISLKDTICSPEKLGDMLHFDNNLVTAEEVSSALCQLEDSQTQNIAITLMKNLNFEYIFKNLMSANVKNILANANLTETEGKIILDNLGIAAELFPFFKDKLSMNFSFGNEIEESNAEETEETSSNSQFLKDSSEMLCGRQLIEDNGQIYKIISTLKDTNKASDRKELDSLPNDSCRETYKTVLAIPGGKIVWSYVKPLLRGQILYAPNTTVISEVMALANGTFVQIERFRVLMDSVEKTLKSLANLTDMGDTLKELQSIMSSDVMKVAIKSMGGGNFEGDFSELNLSEIAWRLKRSKKLISMIGMLNGMMGCVLVNRTRGFSTEEELEVAASRLTDANEFLAGVIFLNDASPHRAKRSLDHELPDNITYKIRMDVDYVPSTRRLKNQFWIPGPESSFIEHLRYLRGFIQLQDSVDRAIVRVKTQRDLNWKTVTQQMPYPCWKHVPFRTTLYESQGLQVCFFFALMMCVGSAVRHIVWERESQNSMVMSVMGLKPWRNILAWFITSYAELSIVMISISIILLAGKILPRSDPLIVLILLFDYIFSVITFCYMISTIFSSASLAAVTTVVMFLLTYMPYIVVIAMEAVFGFGLKLFICLSMSTSFCYGCLYAVRKEVQGIGLTWGNMWEESSPGDPMSLGLLLIMIAFDGCLYAAIGYLIARYTDSGRGFHGLRSRSLWWADTRSLYGRPSYLAFVNNLYFTNDVLHPSAAYQDDESDLSSLTVTEKQIGVKFEGVRKVYHTEQGDVVAVEDFTLKLCEGEVTSLLGRNGAGKTTIIKMLTGMVAPTNGEICLNGEENCKPDIGVCPQDNVLIGTLTPREHMIFYWKLKRPDNNIDMERNVNEMLASLELGRQEHEPVSRLSGGTRRRLCVALAFLGSPRLVILDEPGAGVDPAARRRIWRLIDQHRIGRTVLLSTHHLDEADMLSDTVVVMHKGKILCTGSPLSLKMTHGRGYRLNVSFPPEHYANGEAGVGGIGETVDKKNLKALRAVVEEIIPNAAINEVSESEVTVGLPFHGKNGINNDIAEVAKALEDNRKLLGFSHFALECDTLERVFLDLCARADSGSSIIRASQDSAINVEHDEVPVPDDNIDLITEMISKPSPIRQMKALIKKRLWHFARDWRAPLAALVLPTMFVAVAMGFSLIRPPSENEPSLALTPKLYDTHPTYFYSIDGNDPFLQHVSMQLHDRFGDDYAGAWQTLPNDTGTCECLDGQQTCRGVSKAVEGLLQTLPGRPTLDWIVSTHQEYIEKRYGGWSLSHFKEDPLFIVWYNNKGHHSMPSYLNALNEAILRASGVQGHLTTLNHPLKLSSDQLNRTTLLQHVADVGVALVLLIAFSLVGAQGTKEIVRERLSEEKRILYLAGVHPITYWTTVLIWDFIVFSCATCLAIIVFEIFGLSAYVAKDNLAGVCFLLILFAWAALPFSHLAEKAFDDSSLSNMVLFCVNTFIGVASLATILVLDILGRSKTAEDARNILHYILMIFPQYALGDGLVEITKNDITSELLQRFHMDTYKSPLGWDLLGVHYVFLFVIGAVLFVLNLAIECRLLPDLRRQKISYEAVQEDEDVARERLRVEAGMVDDTLKTMKLRKEYRSVYGTNVAVQNLSFGVQAGKCFGLLGVNGAGKSTTFKMLTTEIIPTAGKIILKGKEIGARPLCNGEVGYCPQSDALDGFLTPHQCLTIHAEVCGLNNVPKAVETTLKRFDLLKYAHRRVDGLSGGNKRKLCAAISVMVPAAVVLMDEPTSGMDPATKNLVTRAVRNVTRSQGCVILTSHSVAECENLCTTVGILARAGLRCIGTPQHLKHKFGEGYVAFLRFGQPVSAADLRRVILKYLPQAMISSRQATAARLLLPRSQDMALSVSFSMLKLLAEELKATDYTLTQSSLDQVLVTFSEELDDEGVDMAVFGQGSRNSMPNMYSSIDTIHMDTL